MPHPPSVGKRAAANGFKLPLLGVHRRSDSSGEWQDCPLLTLWFCVRRSVKTIKPGLSLLPLTDGLRPDRAARREELEVQIVRRHSKLFPCVINGIGDLVQIVDDGGDQCACAGVAGVTEQTRFP